MLAELDDSSQSSGDEPRRMLVARWAELDPDGALAWVQTLSNGRTRESMISAFFGTIGLTNPGKGLAQLMEFLKDPNNRQSFGAYQFFVGWSEIDHVAAARGALSLESAGARNTGLRQAMARWAEKDGVSALAFFRQLPDKSDSIQIGMQLFRAWGARNPSEALSFALSFPEGLERNNFVSQVFEGAATNDPEAAIRLIDGLPPGARQQQAIGSMIESLPDRNPELAADLILRLPATSQGRYAEKVAQGLAGLGLDAVAEWMKKLGSDEAREMSVTAVIRALGNSDPRRTLDFVEMSGVKVGDGFWTGPLRTWALKEPEEALSWAQARTDERRRGVAMATVIGEMATTDPLRAVELTIESLDPAAQERALPAVARHWATRDPIAAANWLQQFPHGALRDAAAGGFISGLSTKDPPAAAQWIELIEDDTLRFNAARGVAYQWRRINTEAAKNWVQDLQEIDDEKRASILREIDQPL